jgi:hypothetical protein
MLYSWFLITQADSLIIYLYKFAKTATSLDEGTTSIEITQQKFIGLSLWIIGYFLALIFGDNVMLAIICLPLFGLTLALMLILKSGSKKVQMNSEKLSVFNFEENDTRINDAKAKFIFSIVLGTIYITLNLFMALFKSAT